MPAKSVRVLVIGHVRLLAVIGCGNLLPKILKTGEDLNGESVPMNH
jgi:hypothetical protein